MNNNAFGEMVSHLRKERGMTQLELAEKMGVTDKAVSKWERGISYPDVSSMPRLAEILGVSVDELMQNNSGKENGKTAAANLLPLIFKAVALAMGVAAVVLSVMDEIDSRTGILMLGIGLSCIAVNMFSEKKG